MDTPMLLYPHPIVAKSITYLLKPEPVGGGAVNTRLRLQNGLRPGPIGVDVCSGFVYPACLVRPIGVGVSGGFVCPTRWGVRMFRFS